MSSEIIEAYSDTGANQIGGDLPYFVGKQYGSGWLGTLARVAFPIVKKLAGVASNVAQDVLYRNKPVGEAIKDRAIEQVNKFVNPTPPSYTDVPPAAPPPSYSSINRGSQQGRGRSRKRKSSTVPLFERPPAKK